MLSVEFAGAMFQADTAAVSAQTHCNANALIARGFALTECFGARVGSMLNSPLNCRMGIIHLRSLWFYACLMVFSTNTALPVTTVLTADTPAYQQFSSLTRRMD